MISLFHNIILILCCFVTIYILQRVTKMKYFILEVPYTHKQIFQEKDVLKIKISKAQVSLYSLYIL